MGALPKVTKRRDLIKRFRELGWTGPHSGVGSHPQFMEKDGLPAKLPNPHSKRADIGVVLLKLILKQAHISPDEWLGKEVSSNDPAASPEDTNDENDEDKNVDQ